MSKNKDANRYIVGFQEFLRNPNFSDVNGKPGKKALSEVDMTVAALGVVNAMSLTGGFVTGDVSEKEKADVKEFVAWFMNKYGKNNAVRKAIEENWPWGPRIFRLFEEITEEEYWNNMEISWNALSENEQYKVRTLADIIWSHRVYRKLTILLEDGTSKCFEFPKTISKDKLKSAQKYLNLAIAGLLDNGGSMIYRESTKNEKDKVYGFLAYRGGEGKTITSFPVDKLKDACETMPDGSRHVWDDSEYYVFPLPWENIKLEFHVVK